MLNTTTPFGAADGPYGSVRLTIEVVHPGIASVKMSCQFDEGMPAFQARTLAALLLAAADEIERIHLLNASIRRGEGGR